MIRAAAALTGLLLLLGACSTSEANTVEGILIDVQGDLTEIESFTLIDLDGASHTFVPAEGLTFHGGPLSHIRDHLVNGEPLLVTFEEQADGTLVAVEVSDA